MHAGIILAGGFSKRFGEDKGLVKLKGKPLARYVLEKIADIVDKKVIVVGSKTQKDAFSSLFEHMADVIVDKYKGQGPLVGALTGFETVQFGYSLLLSCDTPFLSSQIATLLLDTCKGKNAAIPRWPNGWIEPLQAAYDTKSAIAAAKKAIDEGKLDMRSMIGYLRDIRYVSTIVLQRIDSNLLTFFNINTLNDLKKAEALIPKVYKPNKKINT